MFSSLDLPFINYKFNFLFENMKRRTFGRRINKKKTTSDDQTVEDDEADLIIDETVT